MPDRETKCNLCLLLWVIVLVVGVIFFLDWAIDAHQSLCRDARAWRSHIERMKKEGKYEGVDP